VFVISKEGIVQAAGRYLDVDAKEIDIEQGLGGRHVSAAAITRDTFAIAITISESGGTVRIYMDGKELLCLSCHWFKDVLQSFFVFLTVRYEVVDDALLAAWYIIYGDIGLNALKVKISGHYYSR